MKALKPRAMRRLLLFMAVIFPIVYLCGSLFFALGGAHGEQLIYDDTPIQVDERVVDYSQIGSTAYASADYRGISFYRDGLGNNYFEGTSNGFADFTLVNASVKANHKYYFACNVSNGTTSGTTWQIFASGIVSSYYLENMLFEFNSSGVLTIRIVFYSGYTVPDNFVCNNYLFDLTQMYGENATVDMLLADYDVAGVNLYSLSRYDYFPVYDVPTYGQSLFYHVFSSNNFISQLGQGVINGSNHGFAPMNTLFHTINDNVLHFSEDDALAMFGFGYVYYAVNVLVIYEVVVLAVKLIMLPLKAVDAIGVNREGD